MSPGLDGPPAIGAATIGRSTPNRSVMVIPQKLLVVTFPGQRDAPSSCALSPSVPGPHDQRLTDHRRRVPVDGLAHSVDDVPSGRAERSVDDDRVGFSSNGQVGGRATDRAAEIR